MNTCAFRSVIVAGLVSQACFAGANIQIITAAVSFSLNNNNSGTPVVKTQNLVFNEIDPALATITSGTLALSFTTTYAGTAYNQLRVKQSGTASGTTTESLATTASGKASGTTSMLATLSNVPGGGSLAFVNQNGAQTSTPSTITLTATDLAKFAGTGQIGLVLTTSQTSLVTIGGQSTSVITTSTNVLSNVQATLTLNTRATATPEPSSIAALVLGVGVLVLPRRRKKQVAK